MAFTGNNAIKSKTLDEALTAAGMRDRMWSAPTDVQAVIVSAYHDLGYLGAKVTVGSPHFTGNRAELPVEIVEGGVYPRRHGDSGGWQQDASRRGGPDATR